MSSRSATNRRKSNLRNGRQQAMNTDITLKRPDGTVLNVGTLLDQVYCYQSEDGWQYHWSVAEARRRAEARCELGTVSLSEAGMNVELVRRLYPGLDEIYALTTDLLNPLLFVPYEGVFILIDGWVRHEVA